MYKDDKECSKEYDISKQILRVIFTNIDHRQLVKKSYYVLVTSGGVCGCDRTITRGHNNDSNGEQNFLQFNLFF